MKNFTSTLLTICTLFCCLHISARDTSNDHSIMVHNFFNILVKGAQALASPNPQEQLFATSEAFESIANIVELARRSPELRLMLDTKDDHLTNLRAKLHKASICDKDFMDELTRHSNDIVHEIGTLLL